MASPWHSLDVEKLFVLGVIPAALLPALGGCSRTWELREAPAAHGGFWDPCSGVTGWQSHPIPAPTANFLEAVSPSHGHCGDTFQGGKNLSGFFKSSKTLLQREMALHRRKHPWAGAGLADPAQAGRAPTACPRGKGLVPTLELLPAPFCSSPCPTPPAALMDTRPSHETSFNGNALITPHCSPLIKPQ